MTNHIDQLAEWWENAEEGEAAPGDWIITHGPDDTNPAYIVEQAPRYRLSRKRHPYRILSRAPKPKPAWHEAPAVIAWTDLAERQVWERDENGMYCGTAGDVADDYELHDVTPLIPAEVTDEMVERLESGFNKAAMASLPTGLARRMLTVALGLKEGS